ncbi:DUF7266 family protein [Halopelagius longus]|uniref:Uncharacterized protein n=1 Tax=Halopelagius longus TaxID=1236180 RepID=A0A1H1DHU2_9EURY|nr:hypothetical protein [Halopelagius longus]SDQ75930.1 hypothetical protein SAMN05216278_2418 [Halopelagius longus]
MGRPPRSAHPSRSSRTLPSDRALSPVVGKGLEVGLVVLFVALLTTTLYGGVVPDYRTAAGDEVGERALVGAAERIEGAVPERSVRVERAVSAPLPTTIRGDPYRVRAANGTLVLDHPTPGIGGRVRLAVPSRVTNVTGTWASSTPSWVVVRDGARGPRVYLANGNRTEVANETGVDP